MFPGNNYVFSSITDLQGPSISVRSQGLSTQEKGGEPGLCFQGFGTKGSALKPGHSAVGIEPFSMAPHSVLGASLTPAAC